MPRHWGDEANDPDQDRWDRGWFDTIAEPGLTETDAQHRITLEEADRLHELGRIAYVDRPSDRERREHRQEQAARNALRPRTGDVEVAPRSLPCTCGAAARGLRLAGPAHRFTCPLHARRVDREIEAA